MGENVRIGRLATLDGSRSRLRRCWGREAVRDKKGEGTRCQETKHSVVENVRIYRLAALVGGSGCRSRCYGREALLDKEGRGRDNKRENIMWVRM